MDYNITLTERQKDILEGKEGEVKALMMQTLVKYGDIFGAKRLVPVTHTYGHLVTSFGIKLLKPLFKTMDRIIADGIKVRGALTVDPRPMDFKNVKCNPLERFVFSKIMYSEQAKYEEQLKKIGLRDDKAFTCTCYLEEVKNIPKYGSVLSWSESSAVVYANSVLGARCNRNSAMIDLFGSILGYVPEFGLLLEEGRKAPWLITLKTTKRPEAQILGSAIGMKVMDEVPYVKGLDAFLGTEINADTTAYLKDFGAAAASNGAVGLYHIDRLTPEAKRFGNKLLAENINEYIIDDAELERIYKSYPIMWSSPEAKANLCFIGCPHLTYGQLIKWTKDIVTELKYEGKHKVALRTVLCASPNVIEKFKRTREYGQLIATGATLTGICPLMFTNNPLTKRRTIATNSNKLRTYSAARYYPDTHILAMIAGKEVR